MFSETCFSHSVHRRPPPDKDLLQLQLLFTPLLAKGVTSRSREHCDLS